MPERELLSKTALHQHNIIQLTTKLARFVNLPSVNQSFCVTIMFD